jgi:hypothetical protein
MSLVESPLSIKQLFQVKYLKDKFKEDKGDVKRKILNVRHSNGSDRSGKGEMTLQLEENFVRHEKKSNGSNSDSSSKQLVNQENLTGLESLKLHGLGFQKINGRDTSTGNNQ